MVDTHCHLYLDDDGGNAALLRAREAGVDRLVFPNVDAESLGRMRVLHALFPATTAMAMGYHPTELDKVSQHYGGSAGMWQAMERELDSGDYAAIGEVGLDLHWPDSVALEVQQEAFVRQLEMAARYGLPVIIHSRDARDETLACIKQVNDNMSEGGVMPELVFHSFTGTPDDVKAIREVCDPWFGINGVVTFKNAPALREALPLIGARRMLLETDAPWLAPVPHRGSRNESAYVPHILATCARELGMPPADLEAVTDRNAAHLFFNTRQHLHDTE